ncbi:MAG TPA: hypothetical protein PLP73_04175 [Candidatus Absconditabacterales bacterium]|nr:hypothetical protein [Candidatus Absconditabacterales bacterium]
MSKFKNEKLKNLTQRRLFILRQMFENMDIDVCGNIEYPSFLFETNKLLFSNITNFKLRFLEDLPTTGYNPKTIIEIDIKPTAKINEKHLLDIFNHCHKKVSVVQHQNTNLYLTGYNVVKLDEDKKRVLSPVFGLINKKYYMEPENAESVVKIFSHVPLITK